MQVWTHGPVKLGFQLVCIVIAIILNCATKIICIVIDFHKKKIFADLYSQFVASDFVEHAQYKLKNVANSILDYAYIVIIDFIVYTCHGRNFSGS